MNRREYMATVGYKNEKNGTYMFTNFVFSSYDHADAVLVGYMLLDVMKAYEMLPTAYSDDATVGVGRTRTTDHSPEVKVLGDDPVQALMDAYVDDFGLFWASGPSPEHIPWIS